MVSLDRGVMGISSAGPIPAISTPLLLPPTVERASAFRLGPSALDWAPDNVAILVRFLRVQTGSAALGVFSNSSL